MSRLTALPEELLLDITSYLAKDDLCALRLSSKHLMSTASRNLFPVLRLYPFPASMEKYHSMLEHPELSRVIRHVSLNTIVENAREEQSGEAALDNECRKALKTLNRFPNLKSATLRFSNNATSGRTLHGDEGLVQFPQWPENVDFRQPILDQFFRTLADPEAPDVRDISIRNIQNINDSELVKSNHFHRVMSKLNSLRLFIVTEHHEADPEEDFQLPELYIFMDELAGTWLSPCSATLTCLSLYSDQYFGYMPKLDLRGLHFPRLRTLALGNYTISHEWQIDWLVSHGPTLQHVYLDDCGIIHYFQLYAVPDAEGYITNPCQRPADLLRRPVIRTSSLRWSQVFDRLRTSLPHLQTFRMGSSGLGGWHWRRRGSGNNSAADPSDPRVYTNLQLGLFPDRYLLCHMGLGPTWYTDLGCLAWPEDFEAEDGLGTPEGDDVMNFLDQIEEGEVDRADREALVKLLRKIGQEDAEDVKGLMARGWGWRDENIYGFIGRRW